MVKSLTSRKSFLRQPLLHFAVLGSLIFIWDAVRRPSLSSDNFNIVVTQTEIDRMSRLWTKTWGRNPTEKELQDLVQEHIKDEIYYREALKLGLDQNDVVIRRRLRQKMDFFSTDSPEPNESDLRKYYENNLENYRQKPTYTIEQIYYKSGKEDRLNQDLAALNSGATTEGMGDQISLPKFLTETDQNQISKTYGLSFYNQVKDLPWNKWSGPISSGFGIHIVRIDKSAEERTMAFEEVSEKVQFDFLRDAEAQKIDTTYAEFREPYKVTIQTSED